METRTLRSHESEPLHVGVPLSWEQEQIWLHAMQFPELPLYTETPVISYCGELQIDALEKSLDDLSRRHDILRAVIQELDGEPQFFVGQTPPVQIEFVDLKNDTEAVREKRLHSLLSEYSKRSFALDSGPLFRVLAVQCTHESARIFLSMHHLVFDGASLRQILLPELIALYEAQVTRTLPHLAPPGKQYGDYVRWQRKHENANIADAMAFWQEKLANVSALSLPTDRPVTPHFSRKGSVHHFSFDEALTQPILETCRQQRTTAFSVLLTSFIALLGRYAQTHDVMLGTVYGGKAAAEFESVLGCFINIILLRTDLTGDPSFSELLARVREVTLDALENASAPFQKVVRRIIPSVDGNSPVQAVFHFQPPSPAISPLWDLDVFSGFNGCAKFDIHVELEQKSGVFCGRLMYSSEIFDAATIEGMVEHWSNLLHAAVHSPAKPVSKLPLLSVNERNWLLRDMNPAPVAVPQVCMHDLFVQQARKTPERIAVRCQGQNFTYRQLEGWSANIAYQLQALGIRNGSVVALMMERSPAMLAGLLGVLRAGAAYVPLDPNYPVARIDHMLQVGNADLLLTQKHLTARIPAPHPTVLDIEQVGAQQPTPETSFGSTALPDVDLSTSAYILFTSGSTGLPKGIEIPHSALTNLLWSMSESPGISTEDGLLAVTSISFDIAALELFLPLIVGARVELATREEAADPALLSTKLETSGATIMQATPATWRMLVEYGWKPNSRLKILCGGEALPLGLSEQLLQGSSSVWNMYGPTETTIWSSRAHLQKGAASVPLGEPVMNTQLYVMDAYQQLAPTSVSGELYIGGAGLAKGYYGQTALTEERFPMVSLDNGVACKLYRTGDRVRRLRDGSLQFLGRMDRQIKLNGFRIELGEIEHVLNSLQGVREGAVVLTQHPTRGNMLAAYVVPTAGTSLQIEELRTGLAKQLPNSMLPSAFRILDEFPLTLNGKLDRARLPAIEVGEEAAPSEPPRAGTEQTIAGIWGEVLGLKSVGRSENFFDLGGRSLEAIRCISLTNRSLGSQITFAAFIQGPTVGQVARVAVEGSAPRIELLKQGSSASKRLIWTGAEPWLHRFASHLPDDITLYVVTPDLSRLGECSIEAMAAQILPDIRSLATDGPFLLGGFCLRSLLAFEVAHKLSEEGAGVGMLVLGDLYAPGHRVAWNRTQRKIRRIHREAWNLRNVLSAPPGQRLRELRRIISSWRDLGKGNATNSDTSDTLLQALYQAEQMYQPVPFEKHVLFCESGESRLTGGGTLRTWGHLIHDVDVLRYAGIHENQLNNSHLGAFAEKINTAMERVLADHADHPATVS